MVTLPSLAAYPERPITVSLPVGPGVIVEGLLRTICEEAGKILGQPIVVENRSGAMQRLPALAIRRAAPDGYTLAAATETVHVAQPIIDSTFSMRPGKDFEPVAALFSLPLILVSHPSAPYRDFKGMIAYAKANPGKINFAVPNGSTPHFTALLLQDVLGIKVSIVPYKDQSSSLADLYTGRVDMTVSGFTVKEPVEAGKLTPLAVTTAARWTAFPSVPTMKEFGVDIDVSAWFSLVAPPGTPQEIVTKLHAAFNQAMKAPPVVRRFNEVHMAPLGGGNMTPKQLTEMVDAQVKLWTPVLRNAGVTLQ
jgi:tripartite-type tricarboxylate transporter receptor subunit TctC